MFGIKKRAAERKLNQLTLDKLKKTLFERLLEFKKAVPNFLNEPECKIRKEQAGFQLLTLAQPKDGPGLLIKLYDKEQEVYQRMRDITDYIYHSKHDPKIGADMLEEYSGQLDSYIAILLNAKSADEIYQVTYIKQGTPFPDVAEAMAFYNASLRGDGFNEVWLDGKGTVLKEFGCSSES